MHYYEEPILDPFQERYKKSLHLLAFGNAEMMQAKSFLVEGKGIF